MTAQPSDRAMKAAKQIAFYDPNGPCSGENVEIFARALDAFAADEFERGKRAGRKEAREELGYRSKDGHQCKGDSHNNCFYCRRPM